VHAFSKSRGAPSGAALGRCAGERFRWKLGENVEAPRQRFIAVAHLSIEDVTLNISASMVAAAQSGEPAAVSELVEAAWPAAFRIARSVLDDTAAAEDAAQEACFRSLTAIGSLRRPDRFAPWFHRIVINEARRRLRATAREVPLDAAIGDLFSDAPPSPEDRIDVGRAIDSLDPDLRATVVLRYFYGMSSREIGAALQTSPVTARWRLMIAHRRLRKSLALLAMSIAVVLTIGTVVAGIERVVRGFAVTGGRVVPLTVRRVDLRRARADLPFTIVAPPVLREAPVVAIDEYYRGTPAFDASVMFVLRDRSSGVGITIVESKDTRGPTRELFVAGDGDDVRGPAAPPSMGVRGYDVRGSFAGRSFRPQTWLAHGTRIVVMTPTARIRVALFRKIRHGMSAAP
jgi:RNA polymerase sigma-70 factor (ECF subfamily)